MFTKLKTKPLPQRKNKTPMADQRKKLATQGGLQFIPRLLRNRRKASAIQTKVAEQYQNMPLMAAEV